MTSSLVAAVRVAAYVALAVAPHALAQDESKLTDLPPIVQADRLAKQLELDSKSGAAMHRLWQLGDAAVPPLVRALGDPRPEVVQRACAVLHDIGPAARAASKHLQRIVDTGPAESVAAAQWALRGVGADKFVVACWHQKAVCYYDIEGKLRGEIGAAQPWDAQGLPGGQVLVADMAAGLRAVDEKGASQWELGQRGGLSRCQRLITGRTVYSDIGNRLLLEVDDDQKVVWQVEIEGANWFRRRLDGCTVAVSNKHCVELDAKGDEVRRFDVPDGVFGGELLPNGHLLLCSRVDDVVVEFDAEGKELRRIEVFADPNGVLMQPDGSMLVGGQPGLARYDKDGKQLWIREIGWVGSVRR